MKIPFSISIFHFPFFTFHFPHSFLYYYFCVFLNDTTQKQLRNNARTLLSRSQSEIAPRSASANTLGGRHSSAGAADMLEWANTPKTLLPGLLKQDCPKMPMTCWCLQSALVCLQITCLSALQQHAQHAPHTDFLSAFVAEIGTLSGNPALDEH